MAEKKAAPKELDDIKRLLVLLLLKLGASQKEIGDALHLSQSSVSRTFGTKGIKRIPLVEQG